MTDHVLIDGRLADLDSISLKPSRPAMTREEWNRHLETAPITPNQVGRIMSAFDRLGFSKKDERPWYVLEDERWLGRQDRLDILSALARRDVDSIWELTQGEAGKLVGELKDVHTLDDLFSLLPEDWLDNPYPTEETAQEISEDITMAEVLFLFGVAVGALVSSLMRAHKQAMAKDTPPRPSIRWGGRHTRALSQEKTDENAQ